jgi:hypothetical protein
MPNRPITEQQKKAIIAALNRDSHASRVARALGDVSYATVWRVAEQEGIDLAAGYAARGNKPGQAERYAKIEEAARAHPGATQAQLARQTGLSRKTVRRVVGARRRAPSPTG